MVDRRSFLRGNIALAAALLAVPVRGSAETRAVAAWPAEVSLAIVDRQLAEAEAFADETARSGLQALEFAGDVAGLWMRVLEPRLRAGPVVLAGYTGAATLFCLDLLARDYGARTVRRSTTERAVAWVMSSNPARPAPLTPSRRSHAHA
jgi:hypothetical protein